MIIGGSAMSIVDLVPEVGSGLIDQMAKGYELTRILLTGVHYDIFEKTAYPVTAFEVAERIGGDEYLVVKFLSVLTALQLLEKKGDHYCNTKDAEVFLTPKSPFYQGNLIRLRAQGKPGCAHIELQKIEKTADQEGKKPFENAFNRGFTLAMAEAAIRGTLQESVRRISLLPEFINANRLLDLGGGHGLYSIAFAQLNPTLEVTLFDLPGVVNVAQENFDHYGLKGRINVVEGDFNKDGLGENYDIIFASDVFYRPAETVSAILKKIHAALNPGGLVILKHWFYNDEGTGALETVLFDFKLSIRGYANHHIYNQREFIMLLEANGFQHAYDHDVSIAGKASLIVVGRKV